MDRHEIIADIIAEKRFDATTRDQFDSAYIVDLCDRMETAHKRETVTGSNQLREALVDLDKWLFVGVDGYVHGQPDKTDEIEHTIKNALSATATTSIQNTQED